MYLTGREGETPTQTTTHTFDESRVHTASGVPNEESNISILVLLRRFVYFRQTHSMHQFRYFVWTFRSIWNQTCIGCAIPTNSINHRAHFRLTQMNFIYKHFQLARILYLSPSLSPPPTPSHSLHHFHDFSIIGCENAQMLWFPTRLHGIQPDRRRTIGDNTGKRSKKIFFHIFSFIKVN